MKTIDNPYYTGNGVKTNRTLPDYNGDTLNDPEGYLAPPDLVSAVNVALELGMPLLLTGEPGSGKSRLAFSLAWELGLPDPFTFTVKSDTQSRDLFYRFDTLGRFRAAHINNVGESDDAHRFLYMEALGSAIFYALGSERIIGTDKVVGIDPEFSRYLDKVPVKPQRSVVLIDEIDKAPREVPNDILNEIDRMEFDIPEVIKANQSKPLFSLKDSSCRPIVIITSNLERELPEAFLRRCVYFHVAFPSFRSQVGDSDQDVTVERIVESRLKLKTKIPAEKGTPNSRKSILSGGISFFEYLRSGDVQMQKKPSTAELLNWMLLLSNRCVAAETVQTQKRLFFTSAKVALFKHQNDQSDAQKLFDEWLML